MADLGSLVMPLLIGVALKSTVVLGAAWMVSLALRGRSAAVRHLVWTAAAVALLALPLLSLTLPAMRWGAGGLLPLNLGVVFQTSTTATAENAPHAGAASVAAPRTANPVPRTTRTFDWRTGLLLVWGAGASVLLAQMLFACLTMQRVRGRALPSTEHDRVQALAMGLGIRHEVEVLETVPGGMPMTFGLLRPAIFMPTDAESWSEERRKLVLLHELAHVRRGDVATHLMARMALSLHWWNPLAWTAWREFLKERERAADDLVLNCGAAAADYAGHLLDVARQMRSSQPVAWAAVCMARPSQLEGRLMAILDAGRNRRQPGRLAAAIAAILAIVVVVPLAALQAQEDLSTNPEVAATIQAAMNQKNHQMLEQAAAQFEKLRKWDEAQKLREAALALREQVSGPQSVDYAVGLTNLGDLNRKRGKLADAEEDYSKAIAAVGDRAETAQALLYLSQGAARTKSPVVVYGKADLEKAWDYAERARNVAKGGDETGRVMTWMGQLRERMNNPGDAESLYTGALAQEQPNSAAAALTTEVYARFLRGQERTSEADTMDARAQAIRKALIAGQQTQSRFSLAGVYRVGNGTLPPKLLYKVEPSYTEEARADKIAGTVLLQIVIQPNGVASDIQLLKGVGFGLDEKAVEAIQQWKFQPGSRDGVPVPVQAQVEVNFRLM